MTFGIYPGGPVGTIGPSSQPKPDDPALRMAALQQLRGNAPFVVHLYESFTTAADADAVPAWLSEQLAAYAAAGLRIELVLAYRPSNPAGDVDGFVGFVRARVRQLGPNRAITALQITNEANVSGSASATDGYFGGAADALARGVVAASDEAARAGYQQLKIGFNVAYDTGSAQAEFWKGLNRRGGAAFRDAVDWVGLDTYPGTWGPPLGGGDVATATYDYVATALRRVRTGYMPLAKLPASVPIHVTEAGYPTGPGRSEDAQVTVLRATISAISNMSGTYNVSDVCWFDLRDSDSSGANFEAHYGLMRDDYSPKPAFDAYRQIIAAGTA